MMYETPSPISETHRSSPITPRFICGLLLIFIGVVFTLDRMDILHAGDVLRFWPAVLILAGAGKVMWPGSSTSRVTGMILIGVGGWLVLEVLDLVDASFWDFWPLLLVAIGVRIALQGFGGGRPKVAEDTASTVNAVAVMGGVNRTSNAPDFRGGDRMAFMGGCEIDLRQARIATGPAVIDAFAFWGGVEIQVPEEWTVIAKGVPLMGGFEDKTRPPAADSIEPRQELVVKGFAIMGGVEIKN